MDMERVPEDIVVRHRPRLGVAQLHHLVDLRHREAQAVEIERRTPAADRDLAAHRHLGVGRETVLGQDLRDLRQLLGVRGHDVDLQHAEVAVVQQAAVGAAAVGLAAGETEGLVGVVGHQVERPADLVAAKVDEDFGTLTDHQRDALKRDGLVDQAAVGGDLVELAVVREAQDVAALDLGVEDAQAHPLGRQLGLRVQDPVGEQVVAVLVVVAVVAELVGRREAAARQHQRDIVHAIGPRQGQLGFLRIADDDQPARAHRELLLREFMRVRVIPIRPGIVGDLPGRGPLAARWDRLVRATIRGGGQVEAVPVDRRHLFEVILEIDLDGLALVKDQRRTPEAGAVEAHRRGRARKVLPRRLRELEVERLPFKQRRDPEFLQRTVADDHAAGPALAATARTTTAGTLTATAGTALTRARRTLPLARTLRRAAAVFGTRRTTFGIRALPPSERRRAKGRH